MEVEWGEGGVFGKVGETEAKAEGGQWEDWGIEVAV